MTRKGPIYRPTRRTLLGQLIATGGAVMGASAFPRFSIAKPSPVKIGVILPYSGTYALLGNAITDGMKLRLDQQGGEIAGREIEWHVLDSEMAPPKAPANTRKLIGRERVDFLIGPVHSGVAQAMVKTLGNRQSPLMIIPNAGSNVLTRGICRPNVFRASFSNWQAAFPAGKVMAADGHKTAVTFTWKYAAGLQMMEAGREAFEQSGGTILKDITVPFPDVNFDAAITEIASLKPDAVFAFFSGGGAVKFVKDFQAAGLRDHMGLYGPGFLTEGVADAQGDAAEGLRTTLHYADGLDLPADRAFRAAYKAKTGREANVFAVQGYDTGSLLIRALEAAEGDPSRMDDMIGALETAELVDSPRGSWKMSPAHNPVQDFYLREVRGGQHKVLGIAEKALADPGDGCSLV
ncbi:MAG: ABC transporter substrate-binding protein [Magnetovibrionaceae bacterium]